MTFAKYFGPTRNFAKTFSRSTGNPSEEGREGNERLSGKESMVNKGEGGD